MARLAPRLLVVLLVSTAAHVHAQPEPEHPGAVDFDAAERARREGRLADAEQLLRRSLAVEPRTETAFNLGAVLADLGRHREAHATFREVADEAYGPLSPERARIVRERLEASHRALGHVRVRVRTSQPTEVRVDGELRGELASTDVLVLVVDPGTRHVRIASGAWSVERRLVLAGGEESAIEVRVPDLDLTIAERPSRRRVIVSATVAALVVVGAGIALGFALRSPDRARVEDPVWGSVWTLGGAP